MKEIKEMKTIDKSILIKANLWNIPILIAFMYVVIKLAYYTLTTLDTVIVMVIGALCAIKIIKTCHNKLSPPIGFLLALTPIYFVILTLIFSIYA